MMNFLLWPFRFVFSIIGMVFDLILSLVGSVFGLVGSVFSFIFSGAIFVFVVIGALVLIRFFVRNIRGS